ncbi:MAG: DUF5958 family protein [Parcubacteria group bacterium]
MNEIEITINRIAQDLIDINSGIRWFQAQDSSEKRKIIRTLNLFILQSHPRPDEIDAAVEDSGLKKTFTPCVLIKKKPIKEALFQIESLPENEWVKAFTLGINIFCQSDSRRRETDCKNGCYHEWHRLADL